jgi:hypothetical protein
MDQVAIVTGSDDHGTTGQEELLASACCHKNNIGYERIQGMFQIY